MSDDEAVDTKAHKRLLQNIGNLSKFQHVKKPTRVVPHRGEFYLAKTDKSSECTDQPLSDAVPVLESVSLLKSANKYIDLGKKFKNEQRAKRVLQKPLEKPQQERIKRTIGYDKVKTQLSRWDAVVTKNRAAETAVFPLQSETVYINTAAHAPPPATRLKSQMAQQLAAVDKQLNALRRARKGDDVDTEEQEQRERQYILQKLSKDELLAKRREIAYLRMRESQKSAKARLQNKIKSRNYHRLLRREKVKEEMKQFDMLMKTDPAAAQAKLNELEKNRILERASLRHKNTGSWAKNLKIRSKYDREVREELSAQLQLSRQLTEKEQHYESDEDDTDNDEEADDGNNNDAEEVNDDPFNPWLKQGKKQGQQAQQNKSYRKYWMERNEHERLLREQRVGLEETEEAADSEADGDASAEVESANSTVSLEESVLEVSDDESDDDDEQEEEEEVVVVPLARKTKKKKAVSIAVEAEKVTPQKKRKTAKDKHLAAADPQAFISEIFDQQEDLLREEANEKLSKIAMASKAKTNKQQKQKEGKKKKDKLVGLNKMALKSQRQARPVIDEELNYEHGEGEEERVKQVKQLVSQTKVSSEEACGSKTIESKTAKPAKVVDLQNKAAVKISIDVDDGGDYDLVDCEDVNGGGMSEQQLNLMEAFEDDELFEQFNEDKAKNSELKNTEIDLHMPGWGSWAGPGITPMNERRRKQNRMVLQLAPEEKRRDDNKGGVYINEEANKDLRKHLVSDVKFPFTSVQEYEASIRAPIGREFVTETAFRLNTRPAVITQKGKIIEPMDDSELVKPERKYRHVVDRRIQQLEQNHKKVTASDTKGNK